MTPTGGSRARGRPPTRSAPADRLRSRPPAMAKSSASGQRALCVAKESRPTRARPRRRRSISLREVDASVGNQSRLFRAGTGKNVLNLCDERGGPTRFLAAERALHARRESEARQPFLLATRSGAHQPRSPGALERDRHQRQRGRRWSRSEGRDQIGYVLRSRTATVISPNGRDCWTRMDRTRESSDAGWPGPRDLR